MPSGFKFDVLKAPTTASICGMCDPDDSETQTLKQYEIPTLKDIWWRVVCVNEVPGEKFESSLLGRTGHIERANVWTHMAAAFLYALYASLRPFLYQGNRNSLSNTLVTVNAICMVVTFVLSCNYHVLSANRFWSAVSRVFDYFGVYLGIAGGYLADICVTTVNLTGISWRAVADVWMAAFLLFAFFAIRRSVTPIDETRLTYMKSKCSIGLARNTNVDLEHSSLRAAGGSIIAFSWILTTAGAVKNLESDCAGIFVGSHVLATVILLAGMAADNVLLYPDAWLKKKGEPQGHCVCYDSSEGAGGGWIMTSHALWHIVALVSTAIVSFGLEFVIGNSDILSPIPE